MAKSAIQTNLGESYRKAKAADVVLGVSPSLSVIGEKLTKIKEWVGSRTLEWVVGIHMLLLILLIRRPGFFLGDPGNGKSQVINDLLKCFGLNKFFIQVTPQTPLRDLVGSFNIPTFVKEGKVQYDTAGYMLEADVAHVNELWLGNSATLNGLLGVTNEGKIRMGQEVFHTNVTLIGDSNEMPDTVNIAEGDVKRKTLCALVDRMLLKDRVRPVMRAEASQKKCLWMPVDRKRYDDVPPIMLSKEELAFLRDEVWAMVEDQESFPEAVGETYLEMISAFRKNGIRISDRKWIQAREVLAANALLDGRHTIEVRDLKTARYWAWMTPDQIQIVNDIGREFYPSANGPLLREETACDEIVAKALAVTYANKEEKLNAGNDVASKISDTISSLQLLMSEHMDEQDEIQAVIEKLKGYNIKVHKQLLDTDLKAMARMGRVS